MRLGHVSAFRSSGSPLFRAVGGAPASKVTPTHGSASVKSKSTRATATVIGRDDGAIGAVCGVDEDFYSVTPQSGCTTTFSAAFQNSEGNLDLELQSNSGTVLQSAATTNNGESISFTAQNANKVLLRVFGRDGAQARYTLRTSTTCP